MNALLSTPRVGQLYEDGRISWPEGAVYRCRRGGHDLILFARGIWPEFEADVARGEAEFALVVDDPLILLGYRFGKDAPWSFAAPFNWHLLPAAERVVPADVELSAESRSRLWSTLWVTLVDADTGLVRAQRAVALRPEFTRALHQALRDQADRPFSGAEGDRALARLGHADQDLLHLASHRTRCAPGASGRCWPQTCERHAAEPAAATASRRTRRPRTSTTVRDPNLAPKTGVPAMTTEQDRVIVHDADCACHTVHTTQVHHRDFPEIWAEAATPAEGAAHLSNQLARACEGARSAWHRESIQRAIADVDSFRKSLDGPSDDAPVAVEPTTGPVHVRRVARSRPRR
jgi:hypothetical protein